MNIKNLFKKVKQQPQQEYVNIKYSKLDHIGKVQRVPIVQKEQLDNINNQIAELNKLINKTKISNPGIYEIESKVLNSGNLVDYREIELNNKKYGFFSWRRNKIFAIDIPKINIPKPANHTTNQLTRVYCYVYQIKFYSGERLTRTVDIPETYVGYVSWYPNTGNTNWDITLPYTNTEENPDMRTVNWIFEFENGDSLMRSDFEGIRLKVRMYAEPYMFN